MRKVRPEELPALLEEGVLVVDVRPADRRRWPRRPSGSWSALYLEAEGYEAMSLEGGLQALTQGK